MKSALDVHRTLLAGDVPHEILRLRSAILGADDIPDALGVEPAACVAVRCYVVTDGRGEQSLCAVMVSAGATPEPVSLLDALDASSIRPATGTEVNAATDYAAGLVSPLCLPEDVLLLADAALGASSVLYAPTGESGVVVGISTRDLLVASGARVTTLTATPIAAVERSDWQLAPGLESPGAQVVQLPRRGPRPTNAGGRRTG
jgi:prolyl-tRNA editing enzyme YbaK/EbsC (Cys-tRNA(Pro) deacylase)